MDNGWIRHGSGRNYPELKQGLQGGCICSREMAIFSYKTRIWIEILVDFGDSGGWGLDEVNDMRSPCNV